MGSGCSRALNVGGATPVSGPTVLGLQLSAPRRDFSRVSHPDGVLPGGQGGRSMDGVRMGGEEGRVSLG